MPGLTIAFGAVLILLGVGGYFVTGRQSLTAMIPAIPGVLFVVLGVIARNPGVRKHAMHAAAALALLGGLGTISGLVKFVRGVEVARPAAVRSQAIMCVLCLIFVLLCVRSFVAARRGRQAGFDALPPGPTGA